jgi:UDP-3-O-[3-hydroxymyristoyl] glucosamine N-acyltransferase
MLDLNPIKEYLVDDIDILDEADELGFVISRGHRFLTFIGHPKFFDQALKNIDVTAVLWDNQFPIPQDVGRIKVIRANRAQLAFGALHNSLRSTIKYEKTTIHATAKVHPTSWVEEVGVTLEEGVLIEPFVTIFAGTTVGKNSIIRSGVRLGTDALDIKTKPDGTYLMSDHIGQLIIGESVEIGHNSVVDRAIFRHQITKIGANTKIGCLVNISHGVVLGKRNKIAAGVKICGSTVVGDDNWFGPGVIISHLRKVGSRNYFTLGSSVFEDVADDWKVVGPKIFKDRKLF